MGSELKALIQTMSFANPLWGAPRIHGELLKLGFDISQRSVGRLMPRRRKPPSQSWKTFLENHVADLASIDFLVVPTVTFRILFVFVVLLQRRRQVVHFNVTGSPTAAWAAQQIVEAFPGDSAPRYLLRDRDAIYGDVFRKRVEGLGIDEVVIAARSPWQNPYAERMIGTLRHPLKPPRDRPEASHQAADRNAVEGEGGVRRLCRGVRQPSLGAAPSRRTIHVAGSKGHGQPSIRACLPVRGLPMRRVWRFTEWRWCRSGKWRAHPRLRVARSGRHVRHRHRYGLLPHVDI